MASARARIDFTAIRTSAHSIYKEVVARSEPMRLEQMIYVAAEAYPEFLPTRELVRRELQRPQREKEGVELGQAVFISELLSAVDPGDRILELMQYPKKSSQKLVQKFQRMSRLELGPVYLERRGELGVLYLANKAFLNAEDDAFLEAFESAIDVLLLDPAVRLCALRGSIVDHPKYRGRRVFCSGLNLTHLYLGKLSYLYFVVRELGALNKIFRGLRSEHITEAIEKPWLAVVDSHAIGGGCQLLLVVDYVVTADNAFFSIPARSEGFIPGAANLRLRRFVGPRLTRQMIYLNRRLSAREALEAGLVDEVVPVESMDDSLERIARAFLESGLVGFAANRRLLHNSEESPDEFRRYMAKFAFDQGLALFGDEVIAKLERDWLKRG